MLRRSLDFLLPFNISSLPLIEEANLHEDSESTIHVFDRRFDSGWYIIELLISGPRQFSADISFTKNKGRESRKLFGKSGRITKRILYLPERSNELSVEFNGVNQNLEIVSLIIKPIVESFAINKMLKKVVSNRAYAKSKSIKELWDYLEFDLERLVGDYDRCFGLKGSTIENYEDWLRIEEQHPKAVLETSGPLISIVIPVYNPDLGYLDQAIQSIVNQTYKNIEICIADDASDSIELSDYLKNIGSKYSNIKYVVRDCNGHISAATNSALALASGEYIIFMDQDDLLAPHAVNEIASAINDNPNLLLIYSDEDKVDELNRRFEGHFKPTFSPNLLLGINYISHLTCMKTSLVRSLGGLRVGFEGAQDHDLLLRSLSELNKDNVCRIPRTLYHWRAIKGSTALSSTEKNYVDQARYNTLQDYIDSNVLDAEVCRYENTGSYKIKWGITGNPLVSILIPTRDRLDVLKPCIESILTKTDYSKFEILILDNESKEIATQNYFTELLKRDQRIKIIKCPGEFNFSHINNIGVDHAAGEFIAMVNNDIEIIRGNWLAEMLSHAARDSIGCVGAKLLYPDGRIQHGGVVLGIGGVAGHSHLFKEGDAPGYFQKMHYVHEVSAVTAACLVVKKEIYLEVGGFDTSLKVAFNDVDFCLKVREAGFSNLLNPNAVLYHHESISRGYEDTPEKKTRFSREVSIMQSKWKDLLTTDPYYNPNFELDAESYHLSS